MAEKIQHKNKETTLIGLGWKSTLAYSINRDYFKKQDSFKKQKKTRLFKKNKTFSNELKHPRSILSI